MALMKYRKLVIKDTSKRNLLTRIEKRERFLAYAYNRGFFEMPDGWKTVGKDKKLLREIKLHINSDKNNNLDRVMIKLLSEVNWFKLSKLDNNEAIFESNYYTSTKKDDNGDNKVYKKRYIRFLRERVNLTKHKGILYLYSPVTWFAWLSNKTTKFFCYGAKINIYARDKILVEDWAKELFNINVAFEPDAENDKKIYMIVEDDDFQHILDIISTDKSVGQYSHILEDYLKSSIIIGGQHGSKEENRNKEGIAA